MMNPIEKALAHERNRLVLLIAGADEDSADSIAESRRRIAALEAELPPEPTPQQQALFAEADALDREADEQEKDAARQAARREREKLMKDAGSGKQAKRAAARELRRQATGR